MKNAHPGNFSSIAIAAAKYAILAPTAILLAPTGWRRFDRLYRPEWVAAAIALFTLMPYRLFRMAWPWYSQLLGTTVYTLARHVVSGLSYVAFPAPTVVGPALDVTIDFSCGGLDGVRFFQLLSAIMLVLDWTALNGIRTMGAYFGGLFMVLAANALRITLLVTLGNHFSPDPVVRYHLFLGWILYALLFSTYVAVTYTWLLKRPAFRLLVPMDHANQTL